MKRRTFILLSSAIFLTACGEVTPYESRGVANLQVVVKSLRSKALAPRTVYLDIWLDPQSPDRHYLGTRKLDVGTSDIGLPAGQPLLVALIFEEGGSLLKSTREVDTIVLPINFIKPEQKLKLLVEFNEAGWDWTINQG